MSFYVEFLNRDFTERPKYPWKNIEVERFSKTAIGGPKIASLSIEGGANDLWELAEMMRCPVNIWDVERGKKVWWGYVERATLFIGDKRRKVDIRNMANNVAVAYTNNYVRETTTFASNTDSETEFGKKELLLSSVELTDTQAQNYRDTILSQRKYPTVSVPLNSAGGDNFAQVRCRGWYETLDWQYYNNDSGKEEYTDLDNFPGKHINHQGEILPRCAQSFTNDSGADWDATTIYIRARKVEEGIGVGDDLEVYLYDDNAGEPNVSQASGAVAAADMTGYMQWLEFTLNSSVTLTNGSTYWIVVQNQTYPAVDKDDYFIVDGNASEGYTNGSFLVYNSNSASWETWSKPMDMNFRVIGEAATTTQISSIITDAGEFLSQTDIIDASGLNTNPYRDGDNTAQYEIEKLLERGTTNNIRLLGRVLQNYHFEVYEEPTLYEKNYILGRDNIQDQYGNIVQPQDCPVGVWMRYEDAIPTSVNTDRLSNASHVFVDEAEYSTRNDRYNILKTRDVSEFKELFGMIDG